MFFCGRWVDKPEKLEVNNPFDGSTIDTVPRADIDDVDAALGGAAEGTRVMRNLPGYERFAVLRKAAALMQDRLEDLARTISSEEGKTLAEARGETTRAIQTVELSAEEAKRLGGEVLPLDGAPGCAGDFGLRTDHPRALRRGGRHHAVQLSPEPRLPQGGPRPGRDRSLAAGKPWPTPFCRTR